MSSRRLNIDWLLALFAVLYIVSLFLPGIVFDGGSIMYGYNVLFLGVIPSFDFLEYTFHSYGLLEPLMVLVASALSFIPTVFFAAIVPGAQAWFANIFALSSILFVRRKKFKKALILSYIGVCLGLLAFLFRSEPGFETDGPTVQHLTYGFFLWEFSMIILVIYCFLQFSKNKGE